ncbi:RusA family crossover junction endodeoxyribonuclease [Clostridium sp. MB40-C1]|uniref:RusA family crossover junction endodeoxyribonuclease n=1 Tax=Clostridium sp. MB40-C1 TaxID=3070996 RepID=UPI0027E0515F|nr:RusA family crossover junction endodeoxyribonuclease [Clostridium sp. MB40-C1]WMJ79629.1 RusA family crossover junction endodeoxyribonuclease [Clostridium sp. MB40-C1]
MDFNYAKIIIKGSPITKSNFKLSNVHGRSILPYNSGKYHDRYAIYEEEIAYQARLQNPGVVITESLIAILKVYYKSKKRHPDTTNIPKSIFDGVEKSGIIVNDAQIRRLIIEEYYDDKNPRFELELFGESSYYINYEVITKSAPSTPINYSSPPNKKSLGIPKTKNNTENNNTSLCEICHKPVRKENIVSANRGKTILCKDCLKKLF